MQAGQQITDIIGTVDGIEIHHQTSPDITEEGGVYALSCVGLRTGHLDRLLIADPFALRTMADKIEAHQSRAPAPADASADTAADD